MSRATLSPPLLDRLIAASQPPDALMRPVVRAAIAARLLRERAAQRGDPSPIDSFAAARSRGPLAIETQAANDQHYEVPPRFFELVLGPRLKYSSGFYPPGTATLAAAEEAMLALTCERAGVEDGMDVLDLGCGWGSLALWLAERYPNARITGVSNSALQRRSIETCAATRGLGNVQIVTADVNALDLGRRFDRAISIEMFEHVRNHAALLRRVRDHLTEDGALFVHVFARAATSSRTRG